MRLSPQAGHRTDHEALARTIKPSATELKATTTGLKPTTDATWFGANKPMPHTTSRQEKSQSFHRCAVMRVSDDAAWFMTPNVLNHRAAKSAAF